MSALTFILWGIFSPTFRVFDILEGILCSTLSMVGNVSLTKAIQLGKGGPVQAIESTKSLVVLGFGIIIKGYVPSYLQITGVALGIAGASIVGFYKKK
jgi:drug/metabolite transporter (DMT)-like permease